MSISRRKFISIGALTGVSAGIPFAMAHGNTPAPTASTDGLSMVERWHKALLQLSQQVFSKHLDTTFRIHVSALDVQDIKLVKVIRGTPFRKQESYSIIFSGTHEGQFPQETYLIEHEKLGKFPLFLVPISLGDKVVYYEAIFNRRT